MNREEESIIGVILLLFGITWIAYANVQPVDFTALGCNYSPQGPFTCLTYAQTVFYPLGILAALLGLGFLYVRFLYRPRTAS